MAQPIEAAESHGSTQRRQGSPWTGLWAVVGKEMADHLTSTRMLILELLTVLTASGTVYAAAQNLRETVGEDRFLLLRLFTTARQPLPAFVGFLGFLVPLIAIALAFDAVNGESNRRTMARLLAQPIYRDALLLGKFLAGLFTGKSQDAPQLGVGMNGRQMCTVHDSTPGFFLRKKPRSLLRGSSRWRWC